MKRLIGSLILLTSTAFAIPFNPTERMPGALSFRADWIFFSPTSESVYYGTTLGGDIPDTRLANRLDEYHSGYRLGASFAFCHCNSYFSAMWTDLRASHTDSYSGLANIGNPDIGLLILLPAFFSEQFHHFHYHALDFVFGQKIVSKPCIDLDIFAGVQYGWFISRDRFFYRFVTGSSEIEGQGDFWGWGPEIGIAAEAPIWHSFNFSGTLSAGALIGRPNVTYQARSISADAASSSAFHEVKAWRTVPFIDCALGISYDFTVETFQCLRRFFACRYYFTIEAGYEAVTYFDALANIRIFDQFNPANVLDVYRNVTMHGPYIALDIMF